MRTSRSGKTTISDEQYDEALATLQACRSAYAFLVCLHVRDSLGNEPEAQRRSRIALAANHGWMFMIQNY